MRKQIYILIIFIIGFSNVFADTIIAPPFDNFAIGVKGGVLIPILESNSYNVKKYDYLSDPNIVRSVGLTGGLSVLWGLKPNLSLIFGFQYSSFDYSISNYNGFYVDTIIKNNPIVARGLRITSLYINEEFLEIPVLLRRSIINNFAEIDIKSDKNNLGFSIGLVYSHRIANKIEYSKESKSKFIIDNKLQSNKIDLNAGFDLLQPNYLLSLRFNYSLYKNLTESNNLILVGQDRFYVKFHSINLDFTYYILNISNGKMRHIFEDL